MPRKKEPVIPYWDVRHRFVDSLTAFEQAAGLLYVSVTSILSMADTVKDPIAKKMIEVLKDAADNYAKATHGN